MRTVGRAVGNAALAALVWAAVVLAGRELAAFSYRFGAQIATPAVVISGLSILLAVWPASRKDPTGWMIVVASLAVVLLVAHTYLLDIRALRHHGIEQHARIAKVTTEFDANNNSYPRLSLEALDGPPISAAVDGNLGSSYRVGATVTVTTDPAGHVAPALGTLPSASRERWTSRVDTAAAALMVVPLTGWAIGRTRKRRSPGRS
ncbi:hypothetical protein ACFVUN_27710 [Kitasatospora griseola]|uniref:hypothetical protein n=1 Tax=Kitasatospora griseola TaxID=2064 RepID=UPI0036D75FFA